MKRINCRAAAVEAVLTRHGTVVGPLMTDLTGYPELTPHKGGWCGNDIFPEALSPEHRERARVLTAAARRPARGRGLPRLPRDRLPRRRRHRRALPGRDQPAHQRRDLDDERDGRRLRRHAAVPLPPARVPRRRLRDRRRRHQPPLGAGRRASTCGARSSSRRPATTSSCSPRAPKTGIWRLGDGGGLELRALGATTGTACTTRPRRSSCACSAPGDYRYPGADLGVLVARSRMQTEDNELTPSARTSGSTASTRSSPARRCPTASRRRAGAMAFKTA